ncbi:MAG: glycogen debranching protein GlgX, partial [Acidimicrobiia bacterium]
RGFVTGDEVLRAGDDEPNRNDSARHTMRSVVCNGSFDWAESAKPNRAWADTLIYETHVKGMTRTHPGVPPELRGTYLGLASEPIIEYLTGLGVTALELLPVHTTASEQVVSSRGLTNYWGYSTLGFFAPDPRFAATADPVDEWKTMVKRLHRAGIEVIIDVVYNHTAEGNHKGPSLSFRGFDNPGFYRLDPENPRLYLDTTGTGNRLDLTQPWALQLVLDSIRYWVTEMGVDGFRFDLAPSLARIPDDYNREADFFARVREMPELADVKLIAEPWDIGHHGYQLGNFPDRWGEWNGRYRDMMREVWRGSLGTIDEFADLLMGSSKIFGDRGPTASINFITCHDGFTLQDLVSYDVKHNDANGEDNRDGEVNNRSWNSGTEGDTENAETTEFRQRRVANFLLALFVSQGVPMLLGGDELGRTQRGNNNAYCQDNELSWFDWEQADWGRVDLVRRLAALRREHPVFRRTDYPRGEPSPNGIPEAGWFAPAGHLMTPSDWQTVWVRALGVFWNGSGIGDESFYLIMNASFDYTRFHLPDMLEEWHWEEVVSTGPSQKGDPNPVLLPFSMALYRTR